MSQVPNQPHFLGTREKASLHEHCVCTILFLSLSLSEPRRHRILSDFSVMKKATQSMASCQNHVPTDKSSSRHPLQMMKRIARCVEHQWLNMDERRVQETTESVTVEDR